MAPTQTIEDWVEVFNELYGDVDKNRQPDELWIAATAHFTTMGEAIRRYDFDDLLESATHAFCWMCSFVLGCQRAKGSVFELSETFSDIVALKYPRICGHCQKVPCGCAPVAMDAATDKSALYADLLREKNQPHDWEQYTTVTWREAFLHIYGQQTHVLPLEAIGFHFLEEAGEQLTAIRALLQLREAATHQIEGLDAAFLHNLTSLDDIIEQHNIYYHEYLSDNRDINYASAEPAMIRARLVKAKKDLVIEFADTFSWFCSVLNKVGLIASNCNQEDCQYAIEDDDFFEQRLIKEYMENDEPICPECRRCPCECVFFESPPEHSDTAPSAVEG